MVNPEDKVAYDAWPILGDIALRPGDKRRLGLVFSNLEACKVFRAARKFYLWEGKVIGEARVVDEDSLSQAFD